MFHMIFRKRAAISGNFSALKRSQNLYPELSFKVFITRRPRAPLLCLPVRPSVRLSRPRSGRATKTKFGPTYSVRLQEGSVIG